MIISDSSPLIALAKIGRFELLRDLFKEIHISKAVHREVVVRGKEKTGEKEVTQGIKKGWIKVLEVRERVILLAYKSGMISNMKNELDNLRENGFWMKGNGLRAKG